MPTYQYACTECSHSFEEVQSFSDEALTECPECRGRLRKLFNAVGVVFKGSGFYRTDSRAANGSKGSFEGAPETKSDAKPAEKPDTKPDTKSDAKPAVAKGDSGSKTPAAAGSSAS